MNTVEELAQISEENYAYYKSQKDKKETEEKCYTCEKFPYYGKTCKGVCIKE